MVCRSSAARTVVLMCSLGLSVACIVLCCKRGTPEEGRQGAVPAEPDAAESVGVRSAGSAPDVPDHKDLLRPLLHPFLGDLVDSIEVLSATPGGYATGEWDANLTIAAGDAESTRLSVRVDYGRGYVMRLDGWALGPVDVSSLDSMEAGATEFARQHLGPWTDHSRMVEAEEDHTGCALFTWQNVLPSGARTGDRWTVIVDRARKCVTNFSQRHAQREVSEDSVKVTPEEAIATAESLMQPHRDRGWAVTLESAYLCLSALQSPDYGPAWRVDFRLQAAETDDRRGYWIDGMTGEEIVDRPKRATQGGEGGAEQETSKSAEGG